MPMTSGNFAKFDRDLKKALTKPDNAQSLLTEFQSELRSYLIGVGKTYPPDKKEYRWFMKSLVGIDIKAENLKPRPRAPQVGDRVKITSYLAALKHRQNKTGKITRINGFYIYVKPSWVAWEVELYENEIKLLPKS